MTTDQLRILRDWESLKSLARKHYGITDRSLPAELRRKQNDSYPVLLAFKSMKQLAYEWKVPYSRVRHTRERLKLKTPMYMLKERAR